MKPPIRVLTNELLDKVYQKLYESGGFPKHDKNGRPIYTLSFHGTEEEYEMLKKKLLTLDPKQP